MKKVLIGFMVVLLICGCGDNKKEKTVASISDFESGCQNISYDTHDNSGNYQDESYIKEAMLCNKEYNDIEMVVYSDSDNASKVQEKQIDTFNHSKNASSIIKKDEGKNYYKYTMISNGYYMVSSRVDNTLIFTRINMDEKDIIDSLLDKIGY